MNMKAMGKAIVAMLLIMIAAAFTGCGEQASAQSGEKVIEIKERMFIQQCDEIWMNWEEYEGKIVTLEGYYDEYTDPDMGETYRGVMRNTPGCCGNDGISGFGILYDGAFPKQNDWVKATGKVTVVEYDSGFYDILLDLSELKVLDERGADFVTN